MEQITCNVNMDEELERKKGIQAFLTLRDEAKANGVQDLTLDEINEEIYCNGKY